MRAAAACYGPSVDATRERALVVGAVTWDHVTGGPERAPEPGGVVTFAGRAFARLGFRTRVVTRAAAGDDAVVAPLRRAGVEVLVLPSARTTTYENRYAGAEDRHQLLARSDPIGPGDVPAAWLAAADLVHAGPLHPGDVDPAALRQAAGLVGVDVQGLGRDPSLGHVEVERAVRAWCAAASVVQVSATDVPILFNATSPRAIRSAYGIGELLVTRGVAGATLATEAGVVDIPSVPIVEAHVRGAGDTHLAVYLAARVRGAPPGVAAARAATVTATAIARGEVPMGALG